MDPTANLQEQRLIAGRIMLRSESYPHAYDRNGDAERLAELVEALDEWIKRGGFLPAQWSNR